MKKKTVGQLEDELTRTLRRFIKKHKIQNASLVGVLELVKTKFMLGKI